MFWAGFLVGVMAGLLFWPVLLIVVMGPMGDGWGTKPRKRQEDERAK